MTIEMSAYPSRLSGDIYHRSVYVCSSVQVDGSVKVLGRNEMVSRVPVFMTRFWDRHPSLYELWGSPACSSISGFDRFVSLRKRKQPIFKSAENVREKSRKVQFFGGSFVHVEKDDDIISYSDHLPDVVPPSASVVFTSINMAECSQTAANFSVQQDTIPSIASSQPPG